MGTEFVKHDQQKNRLELLPFGALEEVGQVLTFGARKYKDHNWLHCPSRMRYAGAALRHIFAWVRGEDRDPESGLRHLAHATCCLLFLLTLCQEGRGEDDRPGTLFPLPGGSPQGEASGQPE